MRDDAAATVSCLSPHYFLTPRMSQSDGAFPSTPLVGSFPTHNENVFGTRTAEISPSMRQTHPEAANVFSCLVPAVASVGSSSSCTTPKRKKLPAGSSQRTPPKALSSATKRILCRRRLELVEDDSTNPFIFHDDDDDDELPLLHQYFDRS